MEKTDYMNAWKPLKREDAGKVRFTEPRSNGRNAGMYCQCLFCNDFVFTLRGGIGEMNQAKQFHREAHIRGRNVDGGSADAAV